MGVLSRHASNIGILRNFPTRYTSPQFNVVYDNEFQTVIGEHGNNEVLITHICEGLCKNSVENSEIDLTNSDQEPLGFMMIG